METDKIDGMGKGKDDHALYFLISDHLDWTTEYEHLMLLQEKINSYIGYIESKQFNDVYPSESFEFYVIEIHFKYPLTENCIKFLNVVAEQFNEYNIKIISQVS